MDLEQHADGRMHFRLGKVEIWVAGLVAAACIASFAWIFNRVIAQQDTQQEATSAVKESITEVSTQQKVLSTQLANLSLQLSDVPDLRRQVTELKVRSDRHEEDLKELRQTRGLR
ncbi:hypothetical protein [Marilutibacter alkalisoli]|uniref:DUF2730 family protein n=1 Tax=Marilutibacter alkalisoli TaxID=2591633 RepID=A0A514BU09_9GAMM|nr:hypothetical protein [Lysobacter alkalisoli]QDH70852.1 hypothetical protein FKV23_12735 [Lysobacter alkalisoli]